MVMVRQGTVKHFQGDEGIYYDVEVDRLWSLENKELKMTFESGSIRTYYLYDLWTEGVNGEHAVLSGVKNSEFEYIGKL